jgi:hypothetical protein
MKIRSQQHERISMHRIEDEHIIFFDINAIVNQASLANLDTKYAQTIALQCLQSLAQVTIARKKALTKSEAIAIVQLQCQQEGDSPNDGDVGAAQIERDLIQGIIEDAIAQSSLSDQSRTQNA